MDQARPLLFDVMHQVGRAKMTPMHDTPLDPLSLHRAQAELWLHYLRHPTRLLERQLKYAQDMAELWQTSAQKFLGESMPQDSARGSDDRRFRDPAWHKSALFDYMRQCHLITRDSVQASLDDATDLSQQDRQKLEFYTRQFLDAMAPTNFALTNPEVLRETLATGGENILKGLQNLIDDLKRGQGELKISTTKYANFKLGENLATSKGHVVFRNRMMELIQYTPKTRQVHAVPLLIVPPWINKYYIMDLTPEKSLVQFALDQGMSVFMISWVNPDESYRNVLFDDYLRDGILAALGVIEKITGTKTTNLMGYCIGGTLTAIALSWLAAKKQAHRVGSATLLTTLLDFARAGDMKVFIDERQLDDLEAQMKTRGYLEAAALQRTFSILRANDMIWSFVVNNYMLGREPFPFDILYWNEDSTNLPAAFHSYYLRHMYLRNDLIRKNVLTIDGVRIDLSRIKTPIWFLSTREDHIAPWEATFDGARLIAGTNPHVTFTLAGSGHVAGVFNPAGSTKYGYWSARGLDTESADWMSKATHHAGSWWPAWARWITSRSGPKQPATKTPGHTRYPSLGDAPGTYVINGKWEE